MAPRDVPDKPFPHDKLKKLLNSRNIVCVVGYGLSWECRVPHYYDIQKGVWSKLTADSKINPFKSSADLQVVLNWFNWRRGAIKTSQPAKPFQALRKMQQEFNLTIATQCVDGLIKVNGIERPMELYGNVLEARCYEHGHGFSNWPYQPDASHREATCNLCGSNLFPDVEMFGWNSKAEVRDRFMDCLKQAELLIKIGIDKNLAPLDAMGAQSLVDMPVIEILETGISFQDKARSGIARLTGKEYAPPNGVTTFDEAMLQFLQLYQSQPNAA